MIEFEQLLKVFFAKNGTRADTLATLRAAQEWAKARCAESLAVGESYAEGQDRAFSPSACPNSS